MNPNLGTQGSSGLLDVLIRAGLIFVLAALCYQVFAPFLTLMVWALTLAVALYPVQAARGREAGRQARPVGDPDRAPGNRADRRPDCAS